MMEIQPANNFTDTIPQSAKIFDVRKQQVFELSEIRILISQKVEEILQLDLPDRHLVVIGHHCALQTLVAMLASWQAGHPAVVVNPNLSELEQHNVVKHTGAVAWFGSKTAQLFAHLQNTKTKRLDRPSPLGRDEHALILMTSGTTGIPKGIVHTIRSLESRIALNIAHIGADNLARSLCVLPAYFGHGLIGNCLSPLLAGGTLFLWNSPEISEIPKLGNIIDQNELTFMSSVPSFWKLATRMAVPPGKPLRRLHVGSAPLSIEQWEDIAKWNGTAQVYNMYGMTETANWISGGLLIDAGQRSGYVGHIWGGKFAILDENEKICNEGKGEVLVQSPSMMVGYLNAQEMTEEAIHKGWFRTGDIGKLMSNGSLQLVGRIKSEINRAGIKIQAEEIDMLLERHPAIAEACAFGIYDPASGEAVGVAIVLTGGDKSDEQSIRDWCRDKVRPEALPSRIFILDEIPKNDRGKINRAIVRQKAEQSDTINPDMLFSKE